jgi:nucleoid DNA-binding protein
MDELIQVIVLKAGISEASARKVIEIILSYLRQKLPAAIYNQIEYNLSGGVTKDLSNSLGGSLLK